MNQLLERPVYPDGDPNFIDYETELDALSELQRLEFEQSFMPTPETEQFNDEMNNPVFINDEQTGIDYAVYEVNKEFTGRPLILDLAWSVAAGKKPGRNEIKAYAAHLERPIVVIDTEAHGETSNPKRSVRKGLTFDDVADAHLRIIDKLEIGEFDIEGQSMGGIIAAKIAEKAGDRVKTLVTVSTVSFASMKGRDLAINFVAKEGKHQKAYVKNADPAIAEEATQGFAGSISSIPMLMHFFGLMREEILPDTIAKISPNTKWYDFVGSKEEVTNWTDHLKVMRDRNKSNPKSSSTYVLGSETHAWGVHINALAKAVSLVLQREDL